MTLIIETNAAPLKRVIIPTEISFFEHANIHVKTFLIHFNEKITRSSLEIRLSLVESAVRVI